MGARHIVKPFSADAITSKSPLPPLLGSIGCHSNERTGKLWTMMECNRGRKRRADESSTVVNDVDDVELLLRNENSHSVLG